MESGLYRISTNFCYMKWRWFPTPAPYPAVRRWLRLRELTSLAWAGIWTQVFRSLPLPLLSSSHLNLQGWAIELAEVPVPFLVQPVSRRDCSARVNDSQAYPVETHRLWSPIYLGSISNPDTVAVWSWANHFTSLSLSGLIGKMEIMVHTFRDPWRIK